MLFRQYFDPKLAQYAYLVGCQKTGEALIIDPERDIDRYVEAAESEGLRITAVAETHIHADFLSGAREFAERFGTKVYLSDEGGEDWASNWARTAATTPPSSARRHLHVGGIEVQAVHTPGHTPEHLSYVLVDRGGGASTPIGIATGDFVFVGRPGAPRPAGAGRGDARGAGAIGAAALRERSPGSRSFRTTRRSGRPTAPDPPAGRRWVRSPRPRWATRSSTTPRSRWRTWGRTPSWMRSWPASPSRRPTSPA
jgi:glyoxylase-like metal-dependent hydrolase (beta-lactamase superfamily II)